MSDEEPDEYEVEGIVGDRSHSGKTFYFVKWKGFPVSENTWEPPAHLPEDLIADYLAHKGDKAAKRQRGRQVKAAPAPAPPDIAAVVGVQLSGGGILVTVRTTDGTTRVLPLKEVHQRKPGALIDLIAQLAA